MMMGIMVMKSKEQKYYYMNDIALHEYPGCCGIEVAEGFYLAEVNQNQVYWSPGPAGTLQQVYRRALRTISEQRTCRHIQLTIVTKYKKSGKEQCPGFKDFLMKNNWVMLEEFVNPNHGNTVAVFGKTFAKRILRPNRW